MSEYIEREAACSLMPDDYYGWRDKQILKSVPAADVAPVVRCRDCKYGTRLVVDLGWHEGVMCCHGNIARRLDFFCADGAKMDMEKKTAVTHSCPLVPVP